MTVWISSARLNGTAPPLANIMKKDIFISLVFNVTRPMQTEEFLLLSDFLNARYTNSEIVICDPRRLLSRSISETLSTVPRLRYLLFSHHLADDISLAAGMENAIGDIVILADNENFSTDALERGVDICCQGSDIVCGCADVRKNTCYRIGSFIFRKIFGHIVKYEIPPNDTGFRVISRRAVNAVMEAFYFHHMLSYCLFRTGYPTNIVERNYVE